SAPVASSSRCRSCGAATDGAHAARTAVLAADHQRNVLLRGRADRGESAGGQRSRFAGRGGLGGSYPTFLWPLRVQLTSFVAANHPTDSLISPNRTVLPSAIWPTSAPRSERLARC